MDKLIFDSQVMGFDWENDRGYRRIGWIKKETDKEDDKITSRNRFECFCIPTRR